VVNPEKDKAAAAGFEIDGYPTFYLEKDGQKIKYSGPRNVDGFRQFLQQQLGGSA
jgi:thioredoxin-like negative regulator of GroEL